MKKKVCLQCGSRLGLGMRFRNLWTGMGWEHVRFCSSLCEANNELERRNQNSQTKWLSYLGSTAR
jgi:hypothetical protein